MSQSVRSLASNPELCGDSLLHKTHRATGAVSSPAYVNPQTNRNHCTSVLCYFLQFRNCWCWILRTSVTPVPTAVVLHCWRELPLFGHWSMINRKQINASVTAHYFTVNTVVHGARGGAVVWDTALHGGRSWVRFPISLEFFIDVILPAALWPWGWLSLEQNRVPG